MHKWYVVQVLSGQEKKVQQRLLEHREDHGVVDLIEEVLLPTENVSEVKGGERRITERKIWPGYLLLRMAFSDASWQYVKETDGVIGFMGGGSAVALSDEEVQEVLQDLQKKKQTVTQKHAFDVGDRVKINDGVFINFVGRVDAIFPERGKLNVVVSIFGRDTQVDDLEFWQVEEATDED